MVWLGICAFMLAQADVGGKASAGQRAAAVEYTGAPMHIAFECRREDVEAAGLDCSKDAPCPVYLELNGLETAGAKIFAAGDFHTENATLASVMLQSMDGGRTWVEPVDRMPVTILDRVQFVDMAHGWVAGWSGNALSRDPFFLGTSNGGKTWTKLPVFEGEQEATIDQFRFDSADKGFLLMKMGEGMRHQLFETRTGGSSWELIRESDQPVPFPKGAAAENTGWRLRADGTTRAYAVERAEGASWTAAASFQVSAGVCAP